MGITKTAAAKPTTMTTAVKTTVQKPQHKRNQ